MHDACAHHFDFVDRHDGWGAAFQALQRVGNWIVTPSERDRVKSELLAYIEKQQISSRDLAARINDKGKKVDPKTLHRFLDRHLLIDDSVMEVYRAFVDRPG
jgi:hypothetical protein